MNKNIYIISILLLILFYFIYKNKNNKFITNLKGGFFDEDEDEELEEELKLVNEFNEINRLKNINQTFNNISHIPEFVTKNFNYNDGRIGIRSFLLLSKKSRYYSKYLRSR